MLHPDLAFHRCAIAVLEDGVDYVEIAPETAWRHDAAGRLVDNDFARLYDEAAAAFDLPVVAHGVALSPSTRDPDDAERLSRWIEKVRSERDYLWWTDHHGLTRAGEWVALPVPPLPSEDAVAATATRLAAMRGACPVVGLETTASYAHFGDPLLEAELQARIAEAADSAVLLDLHNVWTMARNAGFDARDWLAHLDLSRVVEIHLSGGSPADPRWGGGLRPMWLDGHDSGVPEPVWALLDAVLPYCTQLRGVTLERMEGTVDEASLPALRDEVARLRAVCARVDTAQPPPRRTRPLLPALPDEVALGFERGLGAALRDRDPVQALAELAEALPDAHRTAVLAADRDGVRLSAMLVAKLRFERVLHGVPGAAAALEADPAAFSRQFSAYHRATPAHGVFPWEEAARYRAATQ